MSFNRPTLTALIERARADVDAALPGADSRLRHSVLDALVRMHAGAVHTLHGHLDWIARQILADTAEAEFLDRRVAEKGLSRKTATAAIGNVTLSGTNGSVIPPATILVRADGQRFAVQNAVVIVGGTAIAQIAATEAGVQGNSPVAQRLTFASPVAGVNATAIVAAGGLIGGFAQESDDALLARYLLAVRNPANGGSISDYRQWTLDQPGPTRAWVYPNFLGDGTVGVAFVIDGRADIVPNAGEIAPVQAALDLLRPVTAALTVFAPVAVPLNLTIRAVPPTAEVQAAIGIEISDLLVREASPGGTILRSHVNEAISIAAGEMDHELIAPIGNIAHAVGEIAVPGIITWVA